MKIAVIYATERKERSTTYNLVQDAIKSLNCQEISEFFLPKDMPVFCSGCCKCFEGHQQLCPAYEKVNAIQKAMDHADLIIFTVPTYAYHAPGQLKVLLDHFAWQWMAHRCNELMFRKQVLLVSTAAGAGTKSAVGDVKDSLNYWGVARVYTYKHSIFAADFDGISDENKAKMTKKIRKITEKIKSDQLHLTPRLKVKCIFYLCRLMQKYIGLNKVDVDYWKEKGWLGKARPWRKYS